MSCTCHLHIEVKVFGKWEHYSLIEINGFLKLFGQMAGVRGGSGVAKGLPNGVTTLTRFHVRDTDGDMHHASWFSNEEIKELCEWLAPEESDDVFCYIFGNRLENVVRYGTVEDLRFVFWFDN